MPEMVDVVVTQHVRASAEAVWEAWTGAAGWARWWWPHWPDTEYAVDAHPGGRYLARSVEGSAGVEGEVVSLDPPHALELTWRWDGEGVEDRVRVELTGQDGGTLVTVRHPTAGGGDAYRQGWELVLGNLARVLGAVDQGPAEVHPADLVHLRRCVELAAEAVDEGDEPFGSVLVGADGQVLFEDHNHVAGGDRTQHPELAIARWAAERLTPQERAGATVYTSGEHCPMCAAAHGWVGLGRIVYVASTEQLDRWLRELGVPAGPVAPLPVTAVVPGAVVAGPVPELAEQVRALHERYHRAR